MNQLWPDINVTWIYQKLFLTWFSKKNTLIMNNINVVWIFFHPHIAMSQLLGHTNTCWEAFSAYLMSFFPSHYSISAFQRRKADHLTEIKKRHNEEKSQTASTADETNTHNTKHEESSKTEARTDDAQLH